MKKIIFAILLSLLPLALSSCSTRLSQAEKNTIKSVSVSEVTVAPDSYSTPNGASQTPRRVLPTVGGLVGIPAGGLPGYFVGELAGNILGGSTGAAQNALFQRKNRQHFAKLEEGLPTNLSERVGKEVLQQLKNNFFFANKIRRSSTHRFQTKIQEMGLVRIGKKDGEILLTPSIQGNVSLIGQDSREVFTIFASGSARNNAGRTIEEYLAKPSLLRADYLVAVKEFGRDLGTSINQKTR